MNRTYSFQKAPPLLSNLEAHARTVQSSCRPGLECLPLPRSARWRTKGEAQRNVQARAPYKRSCERAPSPSRASSTIAQNAELAITPWNTFVARNVIIHSPIASLSAEGPFSNFR
jgi:hypothetical protein